MIDFQYNFPLLPEQAEQWRNRLLMASESLPVDGVNKLRPTFRGDGREARGVAAAWMGVPAGRVWITCGGHHGTLVAMLAAGLAGATVAADAVTYGGFLEQARMLRMRLVGCATDVEGMSAESLREVCERERRAGGRAAAVLTMPTVHNPLGTVASLGRREAIVEVARAFDLLLVEDDAYGFLEADAPPSFAELAPERAFYVRSLSKSYAPATRTGFLVAPERFAGAIESALKNTATGTSLVHNLAALSLVADGRLDRVIAAKREEGRRRNAAAREVLGTACAPGAGCAWHLWVRLPAGASPVAFEARMAEMEVAVSGGQWFAVPGEATPAAIRLALGGEVDAVRVKLGVERVAAALREFGG